jgi:hypothetical protein
LLEQKSALRQGEGRFIPLFFFYWIVNVTVVVALRVPEALMVTVYAPLVVPVVPPPPPTAVEPPPQPVTVAKSAPSNRTEAISRAARTLPRLFRGRTQSKTEASEMLPIPLSRSPRFSALVPPVFAEEATLLNVMVEIAVPPAVKVADAGEAVQPGVFWPVPPL